MGLDQYLYTKKDYEENEGSGVDKRHPLAYGRKNDWIDDIFKSHSKSLDPNDTIYEVSKDNLYTIILECKCGAYDRKFKGLDNFYEDLSDYYADIDYRQIVETYYVLLNITRILGEEESFIYVRSY